MTTTEGDAAATSTAEPAAALKRERDDGDAAAEIDGPEIKKTKTEEASASEAQVVVEEEPKETDGTEKAAAEGKDEVAENASTEAGAEAQEQEGTETATAEAAAAKSAETTEAKASGQEAGVVEVEPQQAAHGTAEAGSGGVQVGYKTFHNGRDAYKYFNTILSSVTKSQDLNEYEFVAVLELLKKGHPDPPKKLGPGVRAIQVRDVIVGGQESTCYFVLRMDGTEEDFSYRKCLERLFPDSPPPSMGGKGRGGRGRKGFGGGGRGGGGRGGGGGEDFDGPGSPRGGRSFRGRGGGRGGRGGRGWGRGRK